MSTKSPYPVLLSTSLIQYLQVHSQGDSTSCWYMLASPGTFWSCYPFPVLEDLALPQSGHAKINPNYWSEDEKG